MVPRDNTDSLTRFRAGHGESDDWRTAVEQLLTALAPLPASANFGLIFVSDRLAGHFEEILAELRAATGIALWTGTVGFGVVTSQRERFDRPAVSALVGALPERTILPFGPASDLTDVLTKETRNWLEGQQAPLALMMADPETGDLANLLSEFGEETGAYLFGGLLSSRTRSPLRGAVSGEGPGIAGLLLSEDIGIAIGLSQSCVPLAPAGTVTAAENNVVAEIDGRPAASVLLDLLDRNFEGPLQDALPLVHPAFPILGRDDGDYLVRNLLGIDTENGAIAVGEMVEPGRRILFCRRDAAAARQDLARLADSAIERVGGSPVAGIYISCIARGPQMFGADGSEVKLLQNALGGIPLTGFYANGEIAGDRLYGYTGVLALFR